MAHGSLSCLWVDSQSPLILHDCPNAWGPASTRPDPDKKSSPWLPLKLPQRPQVCPAHRGPSWEHGHISIKLFDYVFTKEAWSTPKVFVHKNRKNRRIPLKALGLAHPSPDESHLRTSHAQKTARTSGYAGDLQNCTRDQDGVDLNKWN